MSDYCSIEGGGIQCAYCGMRFATKEYWELHRPDSTECLTPLESGLVLQRIEDSFHCVKPQN